MTHYVEHDHMRHGRKSIAICGDWCDACDISSEPECPECRAEIAKTADQMFGTEPPGTPVAVRHFDPLQGYTPKGSHR